MLGDGPSRPARGLGLGRTVMGDENATLFTRLRVAMSVMAYRINIHRLTEMVQVRRSRGAGHVPGLARPCWRVVGPRRAVRMSATCISQRGGR